VDVQRSLVEDLEPNVIVRHRSHLGPISRCQPSPGCALTMVKCDPGALASKAAVSDRMKFASICDTSRLGLISNHTT